MFYVIPHGRTIFSSIQNFSPVIMAFKTLEEARKSVEERNRFTKRHYNIFEIKTVWTTMSLDELVSASMKENNYKTEIEYGPVEQKSAVEDTAPVENTLIESTPVATAPVKAAPVKAARSNVRTFRKCLSAFDGPMPAVLRSLSSTISLSKAASVLGIPDGVIKRLAKEGKIKIYNNGLNGHDRRYFIPAADLRRLYKK